MTLAVKNLLAILLLVVSTKALGMTVISCDLEGVNDVSYLGRYKSELNPLNAIVKVNLSEFLDDTGIESYTIDWTKGQFENHGLLKRSLPSVNVTDTTISIQETAANHEITNVRVIGYQQRISIDRFSGKVVLDVHLMEELDLYGNDDKFIRDQTAKLVGTCSVYTERLF